MTEQVTNCPVEIQATGLEEGKPSRVGTTKEFMLNVVA